MDRRAPPPLNRGKSARKFIPDATSAIELTMETRMPIYCGISVDAGVSIDGDCDITHTVTTQDCVEIELGQSSSSLQLCMTEQAVAKLVNVATGALDELRQRRAAANQVRD
jgi:hypothetical protein